MITFDVPDLHPSYTRIVKDTLHGLAVDYPVVGDLRVEMFGDAGDQSMACAPHRGLIKLNKYWFSKPIDELREAARTDDQVPLFGTTTIGWHGGMEEPQHVLCHEFAHQLQIITSGWSEFEEKHWRHSCRDPINCRPPSGYALGSAIEFGPDVFAAVRLNYASEAGRMLLEFLDARSQV